MKKATSNFSTVIGKGGFGTVYKAEFDNGFTAAVKRMNKVSEQGEDEFCREMELLGRLHHRHLVALRGFCVEQNERFRLHNITCSIAHKLLLSYFLISLCDHKQVSDL